MSKYSEKEYISYLKQQRHMYSWCLENIGDISKENALKKAVKFYSYEPASEDYRELIFHDDAWHWAMLHIKGDGYWRTFPELADATTEYELEWKIYEKSHS